MFFRNRKKSRKALFLRHKTCGNMNSIVLIPIYKEKPDSDEILSLQQCFKVLAFYDICLVCPESLDTTIYNNIVK